MKCWISERKVKWNEVSMDEKLTSEWVYFGGGKDSWQLDYEEAVAYRFCLSRWVHFLSNSRLSLKTKSWLCFTPVTRTRTRTRTAPHQNLSEGGVLEGWNLTHRPIMGFWLSLGVQMTHVTRRTRRTTPKKRCILKL